MSNKLKRTARNLDNQQRKRLNVQTILEYATAAVMLAVCCFVPLYVSNGYYNIGEDKYAAFRQCMIWGMPLLCLFLVVYLCVHRNEIKGAKWNATDLFVVLFLVAVCLSIVCGGFLPNALKGYPGWYMGILSQVCFALIYLFASRFGKRYRIVIIGLSTIATLVFFFAILNRMNFDPLGYYAPIDVLYRETFVSTLGQISWYASFWAVVAPLGIGCLVFAKDNRVKSIAAVGVFASFCTLVTMNAESAFFAFGACMLVVFCVAIVSAENTFWFLIVCDLFVMASRVMRACKIKRPAPYMNLDMFTRIVQQADRFMWLMGILFAVVTGIVFICKKKQIWSPKRMVVVQKSVLILSGLGVISVILLIVFNTKGMLPDFISNKLASVSYFTWSDMWGNKRGRTWSFSAMMFREYPLKNKLFGVGPDCYYNYASMHYAQRLYDMFQNQALTNAHNEWLNMLITTGLFGVVCYIGIFVSALKTFLQKEKRNWFTIAVAGSIVSYMAYNFFCYQQVLCTPFIFMLMGFGMYVVSHGKDASKTCN